MTLQEILNRKLIHYRHFPSNSPFDVRPQNFVRKIGLTKFDLYKIAIDIY